MQIGERGRTFVVEPLEIPFGQTAHFQERRALRSPRVSRGASPKCLKIDSVEQVLAFAEQHGSKSQVHLVDQPSGKY